MNCTLRVKRCLNQMQDLMGGPKYTYDLVVLSPNRNESGKRRILLLPPAVSYQDTHGGPPSLETRIKWAVDHLKAFGFESVDIEHRDED